MIDVGFSQLLTRLPAALPTRSRRVHAPARRAYAKPRRMMPTRATNNGTDRVEKIEPNAVGYALQQTVRRKISQTWLASQTGAIASWAWSRSASARGPRRAVNSHTPVPKSAPARVV